MFLAKLSLLVVFFRIFTTTYMKVATVICGACSFALWLAMFVIGFTICLPTSARWNPVDVLEWCGPKQRTAYVVTSALHVVNDVAILILP